QDVELRPFKYNVASNPPGTFRVSCAARREHGTPTIGSNLVEQRLGSVCVGKVVNRDPRAFPGEQARNMASYTLGSARNQRNATAQPNVSHSLHSPCLLRQQRGEKFNVATTRRIVIRDN